MRISKTAILVLKGMGPAGREKIARVSNTKPETVWYWIRDNKENGPLTKASVIQVIEQETELSREQIVEEDSDLKELVEDTNAFSQ